MSTNASRTHRAAGERGPPTDHGARPVDEPEPRLAPPVTVGRLNGSSSTAVTDVIVPQSPGHGLLRTAGQRAYRTVMADNRADAVKQLAAFVAEVGDGQQLPSKQLRDLTVDEAVERFLSEHLRDEKGREEKTISDYRHVHRKWFSPVIGDRPVSKVDRAAIDAIFGTMHRAGLSRSRLNQAKSLYGPVLPVGQTARYHQSNSDGRLRAPDQSVRVQGTHPAQSSRAVLAAERGTQGCARRGTYPRPRPRDRHAPGRTGGTAAITRASGTKTGSPSTPPSTNNG